MYTGLIAGRYATALADFAAANGDEERTFEDAERLLALLPDRRLRESLLSPVLRAEARSALVLRAMDGRMSRSMEGFVKLVVRHRRERYLEFMLNSYRGIYKRRHGIRDAVLSTAAPVDPALVEKIRDAAQRMLCGRVNIRTEVDPGLLGGFVFRVDDRLIDASTSAQLARIERNLGTTNIETIWTKR